MRDERRSRRGAQELARMQHRGHRSIFDRVEGGLLMCWEIKRCFLFLPTILTRSHELGWLCVASQVLNVPFVSGLLRSRYSDAGNAAANSRKEPSVSFVLPCV